MLGMYAAFYLATAGGLSAFLGPSGGPIVAAFLAGPIVFALGWLIHRFIVARVTGAGTAQTEGAGAYGQILTTLGISLILQNGGLIVFGSAPTGIRTPLSRSSWEIGDILLNQGRCVSFLVSVGLAAAVYLFLGHTRQGKALRAAADNSQAALYRVRLCHRHVCRGRAGRSRQHSWRLLGRPRDRRRAANVDLDSAVSTAEHRDLRRLPANHLPAAARNVRPS
jgi:hypothetical protein